MPFTPFHFGIGIAAKAALLRRFSLGLFVGLQVVIDLESLYNLTHRRYPVHRFLHTFVGATALAFLATLLLFGIARLWYTGARGRARPSLRSFAFLLAISLFSTWSHVLLDSFMHRDIRPLWPMSELNPFLAAVRVGVLHLTCLVVGFFGLVILAFEWSLREHDA